MELKNLNTPMRILRVKPYKYNDSNRRKTIMTQRYSRGPRQNKQRK